MKQFILYFIKIVFITVLLAVIIDCAYTTVYKTSKVKRSKYQWARQLNNQHFDYVLLGSSRMIHHVDPDILNEKYNLSGLNLGYAACGTNETLVMLENLIKNNNTIDTLLIQIDYTWNYIKPDVLARASFMPFIREKEIKDNFFKFGNEYKYYYFFPFYRYIMFEPKIGFREVLLTLLNQRTVSTSTGFVPNIPHKFGGKDGFEYRLADEMNANVNTIDSICAKQGIHVCYLTAPIYNGKTNNELFLSYLNDYHDFSNIVSDKKLFNDATHLNADGARIFTKIFGAYYFHRNSSLDSLQ